MLSRHLLEAISIGISNCRVAGLLEALSVGSRMSGHPWENIFVVLLSSITLPPLRTDDLGQQAGDKQAMNHLL